MPITLTFSTAGSFTIEDDGIAGNGTSIVRRDSDGAILAIIPHPADSLNFRAIVPGVNLTFNLTDSLGTSALTVGSLTDPAETPDSIVVRSIESSNSVTLVSNGSIIEGGSDGAADVSASSIIFSAGTGVGTTGNAIETQTTLMEAETVTGGINIANVGALQVGGFSADVDGLDVVTSGDIVLTNLGSITLSDETSFDSVHGGDTSGDVTLIAHGYDSDITSNVDQSAIFAPRGSVFLTAGRDVSFGLGGADFGNDVRANGSIAVDAGRDFLLSGFADFFADGVLGTSGGNLIVNTGRNISLLDDTGTSASLAVLGSGGGNVILTTGPNGQVTLEAPSTNTLSSASGSVIVNADRIAISASSGITASVGVTLRPVSDGRAILLGSLSDSGAAVELSDGELDRIFSNSLILGSSSTGPITVGAPIAPGSVQNFSLRSGTDLFVNFSLTAANRLSLFAGDNLHQLAASTIAATTFAAFVDNPDLGPAGGFNEFAGAVAAATIKIYGNADDDTLTGTGGGDVLSGRAGDDVLSSLDGSDLLDGGVGADAMTGGTGDDLYYVDDAGDTVTELAGEGSDRVIARLDYTLGAEVENLTLKGPLAQSGTGNGLDNVLRGTAGDNTLSGLAGIDELYGNDGDDSLHGGGGNDRLEGGAGRDTISGANGDDQIVGGANKDTLFGGDGQDTFFFDDGEVGGGASSADIVLDFDQAEGDKVHVRQIDANTGAGGDQNFTFIGTGAFTGVAGQLHYLQAGGNTFVEGDTDGDGTADFVIRLDGLTNLVAGDFVL